MDNTIAVSVGGFFLVLAFLVFMRAKNSRFEVKLTDVVVAVTPVVVFLFVTHRVSSVEIPGVLKMEGAFDDASKTVIVKQVTPLTGLVQAEPILIEQKGGVDQIPKLLEEKTEGLVFRLG